MTLGLIWLAAWVASAPGGDWEECGTSSEELGDAGQECPVGSLGRRGGSLDEVARKTRIRTRKARLVAEEA